jgi:protein TonB
MFAAATGWSRYLSALFLAVAATFGVFWLMQGLISSGKSVLDEQGATAKLEFVDITRDDELQTRERTPRKPPAPPREPPGPPEPKVAKSANDKGSALGEKTVFDFNEKLDVDAGLAGSIQSDGDYLPIVKVTPQYPRRAAQRGIEGYVVLEFTVTELGTVESPRVIEADPPEVFDRAAMDAALKFRYKPKVVNGKPIRVPGVKNIIRFEMDKSGAQ